MDALRDVAFHHPVEADMGVRLQSLGLIEVKRGALALTTEGRIRLVHGI
jgi:Mn-dependent DtxR family transcriptional regulator